MRKLIAALFFFSSLACTVLAQDTDSLQREPLPDPFSLDSDTGTYPETPFEPAPRVYYPREPRDTDSTVYVFLDERIFSQRDPLYDSIMGRYKSDTILFSMIEKVKTGHEGNYNQMIIRKNRNHWLTYLLLVILIYFVMIRNRFSKNLNGMFDSYVNNRSIVQFVRDESFFKLRSSALLIILFIMIFALVLYFLNFYFNWTDMLLGFKGYLLFCLLIIFYYGIKFTLLRIVGYIFQCEKVISGHITIISISNIIYAIIALPILITLAFIPPVFAFYLSSLLALAWVINIIIKYLRSFFFVNSNFHFHKFYLFVYLCTLEIAPLLIFMKLIDKHQ